MLRHINAIERTVGLLEFVRVRPDRTTDSRIKDALSSVQIEGNRLTMEAAFKLARERPENVPLDDDAREFLNYLHTFDQFDDLRDLRGQGVRTGDVLNLHRSVVSGVRGGDRFAGQLRREEVQVGDREDGEVTVHHQPPHWNRVEDELRDLIEWINRSFEKKHRNEIERGADDPWVHPVIVAGIAQHRLVWIHPFVDGNGRTARMFTTLLLYGRGYDFKYLFDLSSYYNEDRDRYYAALRSADRDGDYTRWLEYFMGGFARDMYRIRERAAAVGEMTPAPAAASPGPVDRARTRRSSSAVAEAISIEQFISAIHTLPEDEPHGNPRVWYRTQKEHWLGWLKEYHGPGAYGRQTGQERDARYVYNHIVEPAMLLWLIEAAGVPSERVAAAKNAAASGTTLMQRSGAIRKHVPWAEVRKALWGYP
jgi:Fic family protein